MGVSAEVTEARRRWVEALESGEYEQAHGRLRDGDAMCCLGLACDLSGGKWEAGGGFQRGNLRWRATESPHFLNEHLGVYVGRLVDLARRNDGPDAVEFENLPTYDHPWTFAEIAALLRSDAWFGENLDRVLS